MRIKGINGHSTADAFSTHDAVVLYLVHPHKILPARFRFNLNAMKQILFAYTIKNEIHIGLGIRYTVRDKTMSFLGVV